MTWELPGRETGMRKLPQEMGRWELAGWEMGRGI